MSACSKGRKKPVWEYWNPPSCQWARSKIDENEGNMGNYKNKQNCRSYRQTNDNAKASDRKNADRKIEKKSHGGGVLWTAWYKIGIRAGNGNIEINVLSWT